MTYVFGLVTINRPILQSNYDVICDFHAEIRGTAGYSEVSVNVSTVIVIVSFRACADCIWYDLVIRSKKYKK